MTAEIAIMNRTAVTLATDSAVMLTVRGTEKIYNSADKLFELSDRDPLGVMIYNNLEYMGIALEVAIKQFRQRDKRFNSTIEAAESFFKYLLEDLAPDEALQKEHAKAILSSRFVAVRLEFDRKVAREAETRHTSLRQISPESIFSHTIQARIARAEKFRVAECFSDTPEQAVADFYAEPLVSSREH